MKSQEFSIHLAVKHLIRDDITKYHFYIVQIGKAKTVYRYTHFKKGTLNIKFKTVVTSRGRQEDGIVEKHTVAPICA